MTQNQALKIMLGGANVYLTGPPGAGKTHLLTDYITKAKERGQVVAVTATTGIAATHLDGVTLHSWAGIGLKDHLERIDIYRLPKNQQLKKRYKQTDVLVIDEISMLDSLRLDLVSDVARLLRSNNRPMGGIQLILVGDLFQLPPVKPKGPKYIFNSRTWQELDLSICYLDEQHRQQQGDELNPILDAIRGNRVGQAELALLKSKIQPDQSKRTDILRLYALNKDARRLNAERLATLKGKSMVYKMRTQGLAAYTLALKTNLLAPEGLQLKKDCQVIFTANNPQGGYVNGDRGRVVDFQGGFPIVHLDRGFYLKVRPRRWQTEIDNMIAAQAWQLPLNLAWAITIHKSQGMSLNRAQIDLSRAFSTGMGYVALSRLRSIDGLYLLGLNKMALFVDDHILQMDKILRARSAQLIYDKGGSN